MNIKKIISSTVVVLTLATASLTVFAASVYKTPAEAAAGVTDRTTESVINERIQTGKSFGEIAAEAGKLDEFKSEVLQIRKDGLETMVKEGKITQEKADQIVQAIEDNQAICDGSGDAQICQTVGYCGNGYGAGACGTGINNGGGRGQNGGGGMRLRDGSCGNW